MRAAREPGGGSYATYERPPSAETITARPSRAAAPPYDAVMPYLHGPAPPSMHGCRAASAWTTAAATAGAPAKRFPAMSEAAPGPIATVQFCGGGGQPPAAAAAAFDAAIDAAASRRAAVRAPPSPSTSTSESACESTCAPARLPAASGGGGGGGGGGPPAGAAAWPTLIRDGSTAVRFIVSSKYSASVPARRFRSGGGAAGASEGPDASSATTGTSGPLNSVPIQKFPAKSGTAVCETVTVSAPAADPEPDWRSPTSRRRCASVIITTSSPGSPCEADAPAIAVATASDGETATSTATPDMSARSASMASSKCIRRVPSVRLSSEARPAAVGRVVSGATSMDAPLTPANGLPEASWTAPGPTVSASGAAKRCAADRAPCCSLVRLTTSAACDACGCPAAAPASTTTGRPATPAISISDVSAPGTAPAGAAATSSSNTSVSVGGTPFRSRSGVASRSEGGSASGAWPRAAVGAARAAAARAAARAAAAAAQRRGWLRRRRRRPARPPRDAAGALNSTRRAQSSR